MVMQNVIQQYERKCNKINWIADAPNERCKAIFEVGDSYLKRGISHKENESHAKDHKVENTCAYMKHVYY